MWTAPRMQAYVWLGCVAAGVEGGKYTYLQTGDSYIRKSGTTSLEDLERLAQQELGKAIGAFALVGSR